LKNTAAQSGSSQTVSARRKYDAWGNVRSSTGTWNGPFGHAGGFGYQSNDRSGLQLLGHRYYDPETGRFLTRDPIKDGLNWQSYGGGIASPLSMVDPNGLARKRIVLNNDEHFQQHLEHLEMLEKCRKYAEQFLKLAKILELSIGNINKYVMEPIGVEGNEYYKSLGRIFKGVLYAMDPGKGALDYVEAEGKIHDLENQLAKTDGVANGWGGVLKSRPDGRYELDTSIPELDGALGD